MKLLSWSIVGALAAAVVASPLDYEKRDLLAGAEILEARDVSANRLEARQSGTCRSVACCQSKNLVYNPTTNKCFNPSRHPSVANCAYYGRLYNRSTGRCFSYEQRPNRRNCNAVGLRYDRASGECVARANPATCPPGQHHVVTQWNRCASCGFCQPYMSGGTPACTTGGQCTLVCPAGQRTRQRQGLVWCE